jgi:hypothetical protein
MAINILFNKDKFKNRVVNPILSLAMVLSPALIRDKKALTAIVDIVNADGSLNSGEAILISQAMSRWGLELQRVTHIEVREAKHLSPIVPGQVQVAEA